MGLAGVLLPLGAACPACGGDPPVHAGVRRVAGAPTPGRGARGGPPLRPAPHAGTAPALPARPRPRPDRHVSLLVHLQLDAKVPVRQPGVLDGALRAVDAGRPGGRPPRLPLVRRLRRLEGAQAGVHRVLPHLGGRAGGHHLVLEPYRRVALAGPRVHVHGRLRDRELLGVRADLLRNLPNQGAKHGDGHRFQPGPWRPVLHAADHHHGGDPLRAGRRHLPGGILRRVHRPVGLDAPGDPRNEDRRRALIQAPSVLEGGAPFVADEIGRVPADELGELGEPDLHRRKKVTATKLESWDILIKSRECHDRGDILRGGWFSTCSTEAWAGDCFSPKTRTFWRSSGSLRKRCVQIWWLSPFTPSCHLSHLLSPFTFHFRVSRSWHGPRCRAGPKSRMMVSAISSRESGVPEADPMAVSTPRAIPVEPTEAPSNGAIPPLENGDRLTRAEFERRYE